MTSHKWRPGNTYGGHKEPKYAAISYTWGRWRLKAATELPEVDPLKIYNVKWPIPRVQPEHFTTADFQNAVNSAVRAGVALEVEQKPSEFLWLDVACVDQRDTREAK